uniref:Uncharacterized protein n=1 Tax=Meloidogyne enterolobii TaxID=390850 RepID=A0A6V7XBC1_MELEN|nr:unnamed protein product [Meloidogyne enterolobii]
MQLESSRMEEELRERDELLKELTETSDELGRALNEANNDLQNVREQLAITQQELTNKQKTNLNIPSINDNNLLKEKENLQIEIKELNYKLKCVEQKVCEKDELLKLNISNHKTEDFEQKFSLLAISNTELKSQLKAAEMALENDKTKNLEILEKIKEEIELKAKLNLDELLEKEKIKNEEKILKAEKENSRLNDLLFSEQRNKELLKGQLVALKKENEFLENCLKERNNEEINEKINFEKELLQTKLNQLEKENTRLTSELIGIEQKAEREIKQLNNSLEKIKNEKEEIPSSQPIAKPRKTLNNGNGNNLTETFVEDIEEEEQINIIKSELEKQKRLVTVLRKKLQQQQLDALKQQKQ